MGKLGQLLVARGWITVQQLTRALQNQNAVGGRVGTCLLEMEVLGEDLLVRSLSEQLGVPAAAIEDLRGIPDEVLRLIPEKLARRCRAIPFRAAGGRLDVAMQDPRNLVCQDEIAFACGRRVKVHVLHELRIFEALQRYYREECPSRYSLLVDRLNRARYLWGAKGAGAAGVPAGPAGGTAAMPLPPPGRAGRPPRAPAAWAASAAAAAGSLSAGGAAPQARPGGGEVLSSLGPEDLLSGPPRMQPSPLPEPALPPTPRRRSLFRSRGAEAPTPPPPAATAARAPAGDAGEPAEMPGLRADLSGAAGGGFGAGMGGVEQELPPLAELDLRDEAARRRRTPRQGLDSAAAALPAVPPAAAPRATPARPSAGPPAGLAASPPAGPATALPYQPPAPQPPTSRSAGATAGAPPAAAAKAGAPSPAATLAGALPLAAAAAGAAAAPAAGGVAPAPDLEATLALGPPLPARSAPVEVRHERVALSPAERAELGLGDDQLAAAPGLPAAAASPAATTASPAATTASPAETSPREAPASLDEVELALGATSDREEVGRIVLGFLSRSFRRVALFQTSRVQVTAWMAQGEGIDQEAFGRYAISFEEPSVFLNLRQGSGIHIGPLPPMASHRELALCWGGGLARDCVMLPVRLRDRMVTVLYMDGGSRGLGGIDLELMQRLTTATAAAFERCILSKKRGYAQS